MGVGEKTDALEAFHPDRMASRILGMGDVLSLVEEIEQKVSKDKTEKLAKKLKKGKGFDLSDLKDQLEQMMNMGGLASMLEKLPLPGNVNPAALKDSANEQQDPAPDRDHQFHDARRAAVSQDDQWLPQEAHCRWVPASRSRTSIAS